LAGAKRALTRRRLVGMARSVEETGRGLEGRRAHDDYRLCDTLAGMAWTGMLWDFVDLFSFPDAETSRFGSALWSHSIVKVLKAA
jgi:hypothetical protein